MKRLKRVVLLLALCAHAGLVPAAPQQEVVVQDGIAVRPLSKFWHAVTSEKALDQEASQQYLGLLQRAREQNALVPAQDPRAQRLRAIAARLIPFTPRWNPAAKDWKWQVNLLQSSEVNAFCMPGGRIAFFTGIIDKLKLTDDEIAAVMGHEIAHALREHGLEQTGKSNVTSLAARLGGAALSAWLGIDPNVTTTVTNAAGQLLVLKFSRDDEREADLVGLDVAARAGYDPRAGIALWRKMAALNQRAPIELLSTHPLGNERVEQIQSHMNVLLPLYARAKGTTVDKLPPYTSNVALR
ncbi:MAG: M48 family metallopeptidase [Telluria sp.]